MSKFTERVIKEIGKDYLMLRGNYMEIDLPEFSFVLDDEDFMKEMITLYPNVLTSQVVSNRGITKNMLMNVCKSDVWILDILRDKELIDKDTYTNMSFLIQVGGKKDPSIEGDTKDIYLKVLNILESLTEEERIERLREITEIHECPIVMPNGIEYIVQKVKWTQESFYLVAGCNPSYYKDLDTIKWSNPLKRPVESISFNDSTGWINKMNTMLGLPEMYSEVKYDSCVLHEEKTGYRHITEKEFKFLLNNGHLENPQEFTNSDIEEHVTFTDKNKQFKLPPEGGLKKSNRYGVFDMASQSWCVVCTDKMNDWIDPTE